jgi:hypothetical protein
VLRMWRASFATAVAGKPLFYFAMAAAGRGYHDGRCLTPALNHVPDGRWLCPHCEPGHPPPTQHISRRQRREGPWPSG